MAFDPVISGHNKENTCPQLQLQDPFSKESMAALRQELEAVEVSDQPLELVKKNLIECALEDYFCGIDVSSYLVFFDSMLAGKESLQFSQLSVDAKQGILLLLISRYARSQHLDDLSMILRVLPYYISFLMADREEKLHGIMSAELLQSLPYSIRQISHALDMRVDDFLCRNRKIEHTRADEWIYLTDLLKQLVEAQGTDLVDMIALSLKEWKKETRAHPQDFAVTLCNFSALLYKLGPQSSDRSQNNRDFAGQDRLLLEHFCTLDRDVLYNRVLFVEVAGHDAVLQKILDGQSVEDHVDYLASVLFKQEAEVFSQYSLREQQANVLLLLWYAQKTGKQKYVDLLLFALPYCFKHLDAIYSPKLFVARATSDAAYETELTEVIAKFLATPAIDIAMEPVGCEKFMKFLSILPFNRDPDFVGDALASWHESTKIKVQDMVDAIKFSVELLKSRFSKTDYTEQFTCELLETVSVQTKDSEFCLSVLALLFWGTCDEPMIKSRSECLEKGPVRRLFVDLVNNPDFSNQYRNRLMRHYLRKDTTIESVMLAARLLPALSLAQVTRLINHVKGLADPALVKIFMKALPEEAEAEFVTVLSENDLFINTLEQEVLKTPAHPGLDFFVKYLHSSQCTLETRIRLYKTLMNSEAPSHHLILAARMLMPSDGAQIIEVADKLLERMEQTPECRDLAGFFWLVNQGHLILEVYNAIVTYLLSKNSPSALLFVTKISSYLPFSAVWPLLKKIQACKPQDERAAKTLKTAFNCLLKATWYFDPSRMIGIPTWYKKRNITFCTLDDDCVHDLTEKLSTVSLACGASDEHTPEDLKAGVERVVVTEQARVRSRPRNKSLSLHYLLFKPCLPKARTPKPQVMEQPLLQLQEPQAIPVVHIQEGEIREGEIQAVQIQDANVQQEPAIQHPSFEEIERPGTPDLPDEE